MPVVNPLDWVIPLDAKNLRFRPSSEKEREAGAGEFMPRSRLQIVRFKHVKGLKIFRLTRDLKRGNCCLSAGTSEVSMVQLWSGGVGALSGYLEQRFGVDMAGRLVRELDRLN